MLVVIAEKEELKLVEELGLQDEPIIITGVGAINVLNSLKYISKDTLILNIGYCGSNNIEIGKRVRVSTVSTFHENVKFREQTLICCSVGNIDYDIIAPCQTSTDFVSKSKIRDDCVFDMELAFICSMFDNVWSIKVVSDNLSHKQYKNKTKGEL